MPTCLTWSIRFCHRNYIKQMFNKYYLLFYHRGNTSEMQTIFIPYFDLNFLSNLSLIQSDEIIIKNFVCLQLVWVVLIISELYNGFHIGKYF